jgi:hypothetical protein
VTEQVCKLPPADSTISCPPGDDDFPDIAELVSRCYTHFCLYRNGVMICCRVCGKEFRPGENSGHVASISGSIMGDECIESYYFCEECQVYTVEVYFDYFSGEEVSNVYGPIDKNTGDEKIALINRCPEPWNKKCRCSAHLEYFQGTLD